MRNNDSLARLVCRSIIVVSALCGLGPAGEPKPGSSVPAIIPQPVRTTLGEGVFRFTPRTRIIASGKAADEAAKLADALAPAMGFRLELAGAASQPADAIALSLDPSLQGESGDEGYALDVMPDRIALRSAQPAGLFWGIQTLRQLLPPGIYRHARVDGAAWTAPCVRIADYPRFAWRGLLIDPARHFIPKRDVMRYIDAMAVHKFNRLQVHLTDDQGWRIEIGKYPKLTEIGSRMHYSVGRQRDRAVTYGGYYAQDDIRELVRYAAERHITIIPEIEMPAHTGAAIVAYPQLGLNADELAKLPPDQRWGKTRGILAPRPQTVAFMQDVLAEVVAMFPSRYIHIGGDEANTDHWKDDPEMQALMKRLGCQDVHGLHSWFIKEMDAWLMRQGRRLVGWDEILQGGLAPGAVVMSWRGESGGVKAAQAGHDVIMAPTSHTYFDYYQGPPEAEPPAIGGSVPLEKVYGYEPVPAALDAEQARRILGAQGQLWGEFMPNERHREYMTYPRACALIEAFWSPRQDRDYGRFLVRLKHHLERLDAAGVNYRRLDGS